VIDDLAQATLHHVFVGKDDDDQCHHSVYSICEEFLCIFLFVLVVMALCPLIRSVNTIDQLAFVRIKLLLLKEMVQWSTSLKFS
jgi:hypothetical protein